MGSVWKVYDKQLEGTFAVKVLKPELLADATAVKRFEKEANLASDLTHANIAAIFGPGTDSQGRPFIIMGYVDGESLADILAREGKLSEERALDIFTQICEALSHSHMKGIIHRDIKPSNIIISKTESGGDMVHIVDFGIARCIYDEVTKTQALTKAVDIFGSPRYMSPEQFLGNNVTGQSDIYSLGCVFYEMLTGAPPFTDENPVKLILQHISETPDLAKIPLKLQLLLLLCLAKEPEQRVQTVEHLLERIPTLDVNPLTNSQPTYLLHCLTAVALILIAGLDSVAFSRSSAGVHFPILLLLWLYILVVNRDNAGRSVNYRILEVNVFLAAFASLFIDSVAVLQMPLLSTLISCCLAALSLALIFQPRVIEIYSNCVSTFTSQSMSWRPRLILNNKKLLSSLAVTVMRWSITFLCFMASVFAFVVTVGLCCGARVGGYFANYVLIPPTCFFVVFSFLYTLLRLLDDRMTNTRSIQKSLQASVKLQTVMVSVVVLVAVAITSTVGKNGFNQFLKQEFEDRVVGGKQQQVRLEALTYPDTLLGNQARLTAAYYLMDAGGRNSDALALCQQIIQSKREKEPVTLATAYVSRAKVRGLEGRIDGDSADLERALMLLEGAKRPSLSDWESTFLYLYRSHFVASAALSIGELAVKNNDIVLSTRALALMKRLGENQNSYMEYYRKELQAKIDALSAPKPPSAVDRK
jgi:serine/threonine protein kinase